eukprot:8880814-Alexandrium_andersonii.AAC.1
MDLPQILPHGGGEPAHLVGRQSRPAHGELPGIGSPAAPAPAPQPRLKGGERAFTEDLLKWPNGA